MLQKRRTELAVQAAVPPAAQASPRIALSSGMHDPQFVPARSTAPISARLVRRRVAIVSSRVRRPTPKQAQMVRRGSFVAAMPDCSYEMRLRQRLQGKERGDLRATRVCCRSQPETYSPESADGKSLRLTHNVMRTNDAQTAFT